MFRVVFLIVHLAIYYFVFFMGFGVRSETAATREEFNNNGFNFDVPSENLVIHNERDCDLDKMQTCLVGNGIACLDCKQQVAVECKHFDEEIKYQRADGETVVIPPNTNKLVGYCTLSHSKPTDRTCNSATGEWTLMKVDEASLGYMWLCRCRYPWLVTQKTVTDDCDLQVACNGQGFLMGDNANPMLDRCNCIGDDYDSFHNETFGPSCRRRSLFNRTTWTYAFDAVKPFGRFADYFAPFALMPDPQTLDIIGNKMFAHYDRPNVETKIGTVVSVLGINTLDTTSPDFWTYLVPIRISLDDDNENNPALNTPLEYHDYEFDKPLWNVLRKRFKMTTTHLNTELLRYFPNQKVNSLFSFFWINNKGPHWDRLQISLLDEPFTHKAGLPLHVFGGWSAFCDQRDVFYNIADDDVWVSPGPPCNKMWTTYSGWPYNAEASCNHVDDPKGWNRPSILTFPVCRAPLDQPHMWYAIYDVDNIRGGNSFRLSFSTSFDTLLGEFGTQVKDRNQLNLWKQNKWGKVDFNDFGYNDL